MKQKKSSTAAKSKTQQKRPGTTPPPVTSTTKEKDEGSSLSFSAVETAISSCDKDDAAVMAKAKQKVGRRTKETAEAQPTRPLRRGHSDVAKLPSRTSATTATTTIKDRAKRSSSFDSEKWERRVSTQTEKGNHKQQQGVVVCLDGDAPSSSAAAAAAPSRQLTEVQAAILAKEQQRRMPPVDERSSATTTTNNDSVLMIGAFRMQPSGATSAQEYDANDDYPADSSGMNDSSRNHNNRRSSSSNGGRGGMTDRSDKEHNALLDTNGEGSDILIEATLVTEQPKTIAGDDAEPPPPIVPEPELVTAHPMKESVYTNGEDASKQQRYRWVIGGLLCLLVTFLIVGGIALGVQVNNSKNGNSEDINRTGDAGIAQEEEEIPLTRDVLPTATQVALEDPMSPQSQGYQWYEQDLQINQEGPTPSDMAAYFPLQRFALATFYFAMQGSGWTEDDSWLEDGTDPCDWHTTFFGTICTTGRRRQLRRRELQQQQQQQPRRHYQRLSLFKNNLVGTLPPELALLSKLDVVNLHENAISGSVPSELGLWHDVTLLQMFNNSLSSSLPSELSELSQIRQLNFAFNVLTGSLPTELSRLTTMEVFSVSNNQISGVVPTEFGRLEQLEELYLYENPNLGGSLPSELGLLSNLVTLQMNHIPNLTGSIPSELGQLSNTQEIQLQKTGISGTIPSTLGLLSQLTHLALHETKLTGTVPIEVCALKEAGILQEISVDCFSVKCSCKCDCSASTDNKVKDSMTATPAAEASAAPELIENPPILTNAEVTGLGEDSSTP